MLEKAGYEPIYNFPMFYLKFRLKNLSYYIRSNHFYLSYLIRIDSIKELLGVTEIDFAEISEGHVSLPQLPISDSLLVHH